MSNPPTPPIDYNELRAYQVRLKGQLGADSAEWFGGLTLTLDENGETPITGPALDQAALQGLLKNGRDSGLTLVSVKPWMSQKRRKKCTQTST